MTSILVEEARRITDTERPDGSWQRAASLLLRQALEEHAAVFWSNKGLPSVARAKQRHQLISLPYYLRQPDGLAEEVRYAWNRLTTACHAGPRIVLPTADELRSLAEVVERFENVGTPP